MGCCSLKSYKFSMEFPMKTNNGNGEHFTLAFLMDLGQKTQKITSQNANWNNGKLYFLKGKKHTRKKPKKNWLGYYAQMTNVIQGFQLLWLKIIWHKNPKA